jgi:hypothetical protein
MEDKKLNEVANDFFTFLYGKPKKKILRPLVKQLTYKGITKKWTEDGQGNFLDYVGKPKIVYDIAKKESETIEDFTKRMIDEGIFN